MDKTDSIHSDITNRLAEVSDTPALDASVLISHILNRPRTWVLAHPETVLTQPQLDSLEQAVSRFENGEPLPYIIGHWEFFGIDFNVTPDVLIPRPETELLVEKAIAWLQTRNQSNTLKVADLGTGSGAIAISIAVHVTKAKIIATDISRNALQVAKRNAEKHGVNTSIEFAECDLLPEKSSFVHHESPIDLICANLPYIPTKELKKLPVYGQEPTLALDGGEDGLDQFRKLIKVAPEYIAPNGLMLLEVEANQGVKTLSLAQEAFPDAGISLHKDLAGKNRLLKIAFAN